VTADQTVGRITFAPTPGPWRVSSLDGRTVGPVRALFADGTAVQQLQAVAIVKERTGESDANANLIAAAPELLKALKQLRHVIYEVLKLDPVDHEYRSICEQADAAIAKAEGET